eukprot:TRINITY_DN3685_c0_g1_i1.p1 TRINITY_DN3685_c0_g1~~TRINITY_DN3685_c0_g1_i1.p1  ORF type:complete len:244 (+),score=7.23 TRINITY_DN3685_c0_g1_i1:51-782(+)
MPDGGAIVKLNIGGIPYVCTRDTLLSQGDNFFAAVLREEDAENCPVLRLDGGIFIDRDGELFKYVLDYLRTGNLLSFPPTPEDIERLKAEAQFYCVPDLVELLSAKLAPVEEKAPVLQLRSQGYYKSHDHGCIWFAEDGKVLLCNTKVNAEALMYMCYHTRKLPEFWQTDKGISNRFATTFRDCCHRGSYETEGNALKVLLQLQGECICGIVTQNSLIMETFPHNTEMVQPVVYTFHKWGATL